MSKRLRTFESFEKHLKQRLEDGTLTRADENDIRMLLERSCEARYESARNHFLHVADAILNPPD